ncbi:MAG: MFS transporter [Acidimicrobiia bacterium]|nr:MFS transporter [Acidimicrobiia bacterium]
MAVHRPEPRDEADPPEDATPVEASGPDVDATMPGWSRASLFGEDTETLFTKDPSDRPGFHVRLFGSHEFFRLWLVQVVSATGDWLGFSAIILLAATIGGGAGAGAISLVMAARIVPGFFFGPLAGVLVDRWDRKKVMVSCDIGRAVVMVLLPFVSDVIGLVLASLVLEVLTLLWGPAKDSEVPNLVPPEHLTTANSLSLAAAYGTFPFASLLFALLAGLSVWIGRVPGLGWLETNQMAFAFYADALTFVFSAWMISRLTFPERERRVRTTADDERRVDIKATLQELREGWNEIWKNHTIRAVNLGLATGLIGGGMLIPLGAVFSTEVLDAGAAGYGLFTTALGFGVAIGVVGVSLFQKRLPQTTTFTAALFVAGIALFCAASSSSLWAAVIFVGLMGIAVGPVYVLGFAMLQQEVADDLRGRVFSSLNTLVRMCVLIAMVAGPLLAAILGRIASTMINNRVDLGGKTLELPGVRLALWLAALIIIAAGFVAGASLRAGQRTKRAGASAHPSRPNPPDPQPLDFTPIDLRPAGPIPEPHPDDEASGEPI